MPKRKACRCSTFSHARASPLSKCKKISLQFEIAVMPDSSKEREKEAAKVLVGSISCRVILCALDIPNIAGVLRDGAVAGKFPDPSDVQNRHPRPAVRSPNAAPAFS